MFLFLVLYYEYSDILVRQFDEKAGKYDFRWRFKVVLPGVSFIIFFLFIHILTALHTTIKAFSLVVSGNKRSVMKLIKAGIKHNLTHPTQP